jgi:GlpG protein
VHDQTVKLFLVWLVVCGVLTRLGLMQIANWAHLFGLFFGVAAAAVFVTRWRLPLTAPAFAVLMALSFLPLKWSPLSADWTAKQAELAQTTEELRKTRAGAGETASDEEQSEPTQ